MDVHLTDYLGWDCCGRGAFVHAVPQIFGKGAGVRAGNEIVRPKILW